MARSHYLSHEGIHLASLKVAGCHAEHKFGVNSSIGGSYEIISEMGGSSITYPTTAAVASINSASGNSGSVITVEGLDANMAEVTDTITLDGSGDGSTTQTFLRINRAFVSNDDTIGSDLNITIGGNTQIKIDSTHQESLQCTFTVPANKRAFLVQLNGGVDEKEKPVEMRVSAREAGGVFRTRDYVSFQTSLFQKGYDVPVMFGPETDIQLQAKSPDGTIGISGCFDIILVNGK